MKRRVAARAVIFDKDKLFCVKLKVNDGDSVKVNDYWCLPGGGIDIGENPIDGLKREIKEELDITADVGNLLYINQFIFNEKEHLEFFFHCTNTEDFHDIDLSGATHADEEIAEIGFIDPTSATVKPEFLATEDLRLQINGSPVKVISTLERR